MLDCYRKDGSDMTVEDALWYFEDRLRQEQDETDAARRLLKTRPGVLRHEIREAVRKDRHLLEDVPNAE
jgi:hypothetical protein